MTDIATPESDLGEKKGKRKPNYEHRWGLLVTRKRAITDKISVQEQIPGCSQQRGSQPGMKAAGAALCYGLMPEGRASWCNSTAKMLRNYSFKLFKTPSKYGARGITKLHSFCVSSIHLSLRKHTGVSRGAFLPKDGTIRNYRIKAQFSGNLLYKVQE